MRTRKELMIQLEDTEKANCFNCSERALTPKQSKKCRECPIREELQAIGDELLKTNTKRDELIKNTLAKGQDMTKTDVKMLIELEVNRKKIRKHMEMGDNAFFKMLQAWGISASEMSEGQKVVKSFELTIEEYMGYKAKKMNDPKIAELKGISQTSLYRWKKDNHLTRVVG